MQVIPHINIVKNVLWSNDGTYFVTLTRIRKVRKKGLYDFLVIVWDYEAKEIGRFVLNNIDKVDLKFDPSGNITVVVPHEAEEKKGTTRIILLDKQCIVKKENTLRGVALSSAWSNKGELLSLNVNGKVVLLNENLELSSEYKSGEVTFFKWFPDDDLLSGIREKKVAVWDYKKPKTLFDLKVKGDVKAMDISFDGRYIAAIGNKGGEVKIWELQFEGNKIKPVEIFKDKVKHGISIKWNPRNLQVAYCGDSLIVYDVETQSKSNFGKYCGEIKWSPDGEFLAVAKDNKIFVQNLIERDRKKELFHGGKILDFTWSPTSKQLLVGSRDYAARLWERGDDF